MRRNPSKSLKRLWERINERIDNSIYAYLKADIYPAIYLLEVFHRSNHFYKT
tara:strand:+ start:350 stop:505 length:156 start_codon:yes stop_codon:yes gene_type:complete